MCFPQRLYLRGSVSGCGCIRRVGTCAVIKPFCVERGARSICCRYPWSNPALWPHRGQHPPPAPFPFHRHQNVATGTRTLIQIFHGHLPWNDGGWKRKGLPKGGGRNVSVISPSGSHECAMIPNQNAAIAAQYFKRCLALMPPCWGHNIDGSMGNVKVSNSARRISGGKKITHIHTQTWRYHIGKCWSAAPSERGIVFPGQACPLPSFTLVLLYYFLWRLLALSLMLLFLHSPNAICQ